MARVIEEKKKKQEKKTFTLDEFLQSEGLDEGVKEKPREYYDLGPAFSDALGLKGIPKGYVCAFRGHSDTGKSTALWATAVAAQQCGDLPVIIDSEGNVDFEHLIRAGLKATKIVTQHVDEETGEETEQIDYKGHFIYVSNYYLMTRYGQKRPKEKAKQLKHNQATIEDVAELINDLLQKQAAGKLPYNLCFLWDSIGCLDCDQAIESDSKNNQWNAGAMKLQFNSINYQLIPNSRKVTSEYINTFCAVQQVRVEPPTMPGAPPTQRPRGGDSFWYSSRMQFQFGGEAKASVKKLYATANGREYQIGAQVAVKGVKVQAAPVSYKGDLITTAFGFIPATKEAIEIYKKERRSWLLQQLEINDSDVEIGILEKEVPVEE